MFIMIAGKVFLELLGRKGSWEEDPAGHVVVCLLGGFGGALPQGVQKLHGVPSFVLHTPCVIYQTSVVMIDIAASCMFSTSRLVFVCVRLIKTIY